MRRGATKLPPTRAVPSETWERGMDFVTDAVRRWIGFGASTSSRARLRLSDETLENLHRIPRCSLEELVAADEEGEAAGMRQIAADAADENVELATRFERHRKVILLAAVDDFDPGRTGENFTRFLG